MWVLYIFLLFCIALIPIFLSSENEGFGRENEGFGRENEGLNEVKMRENEVKMRENGEFEGVIYLFFISFYYLYAFLLDIWCVVN